MAIFDLFSKRQKRLRGEVPDVYSYDAIPHGLRVQIIHIWHDGIGDLTRSRENNVIGAYREAVAILSREYGLMSLNSNHFLGEYQQELEQFFLESHLDQALDVIEITFKIIDFHVRDFQYRYQQKYNDVADECIAELNARFKEHGVGYQYVNGEIVRVDSELLHVEAVKPALALLNDPTYSGPQEEFLAAYEHYRHGKNKDALNNCLKAFESTMKAICDKHGWQYEKGDTAKRLIEICFEKGLVPSFWQQQFASLRSLLQSSVPTGRNRLGGHGQGAQPVEVPDHIAAYMLHMTASTLVFLVRAEQSLGK